MTLIDHVLDMLPGHPWVLHYGKVRLFKVKDGEIIDCDCPLSFLGQTWGGYRGGQELGLSDDDTNAIIGAADNFPGHDRSLRLRLLAKCGLREEGGTQ